MERKQEEKAVLQRESYLPPDGSHSETALTAILLIDSIQLKLVILLL